MKTLLAASAALFLIGCSEPPKAVETKKEPAKPAEPVTGRYAFYQMYPSARTWAADAQPIQLKSVPLAEVKSTPGKSGAWLCMFVSPSRGKQKPFSWSAIEAEGNLHKGVFGGLDESYSPSRQAQPFLIAAIKTDTDEVWETAAKKSADYMKKNPDKPITFLLELTPRFPDLAWRVIWGESVNASDYSVFVDATNGQFLEKTH